MKGIFANGLEMPKNCRTCQLRRIYQYMKPCPCPAVRGSGSLVYHAKDAEQRREGCPLIGMPDDWEPITTVRVVDGQIMILPFDKETAARSYEDGITAGRIEERSKMYSRCYPEIASFLEREGLDNPDELAEYICQIIKGFTADEMEDMIGPGLWKDLWKEDE